MRMIGFLIAVLASSPVVAQTAICKTGTCSYQNTYNLTVPTVAPANPAPAPVAAPACVGGQCSNTAYQYPYYPATPSYPVASPTPRTVVSRPAAPRRVGYYYANGFWYQYNY